MSTPPNVNNGLNKSSNNLGSFNSSPMNQQSSTPVSPLHELPRSSSLTNLSAQSNTTPNTPNTPASSSSQQQQQQQHTFGSTPTTPQQTNINIGSSSLKTSAQQFESFGGTTQQSYSSQPPSYFPNPQYSNSSSLTGDETTLKRLIKIGNWNNVFKVAELCIANTNNPHSILQYKLCRIIAHVKMRSYANADSEIKGIGDIRDLVNCYESYPQLFPSKKGTMVPFSMRIIKAELACHLNTEKFQLDSLYGLLSICKKEIQSLNESIKTANNIDNRNNGGVSSSGGNTIKKSTNTIVTEELSKNHNIYLSQLENTTSSLISPRIEDGSSNGGNANNVTTPSTPLPISSLSVEDIFEQGGTTTLLESLAIWKSRERRITFSIVTTIIQKNRDFLLAIKILEDLISKYSADIYILSALGRIHLQMGNLKGGFKIFQIVDDIIKNKIDSTNNNGNNSNNNNGFLILSLMNHGFYAISNDQYPLAIEYFEKVISIEPNNIAAINNKCISMLYTCDLGGAITLLESVLANEREKSIDETLIFNICSLFELASDKSNDKKKSIMGDIAKRAPDNFDFKSFKI